MKGFGQASDMIKFAPKAQLSAIVNNWGAYYLERTNAMMNGSWKSQDVWYGLKEGMVQMAPYTNMSSDSCAPWQKRLKMQSVAVLCIHSRAQLKTNLENLLLRQVK